MISGKNNVLLWFQDLNVPFYAVYYKSKVEAGNPIFKSHNENATPGDAAQELSKKLDLLDYGQYTIMAGDKASVAARGNFRTDFTIYSIQPQGNITPATAPQVAGISPDDFEKRLEEKMAAYKDALDKQHRIELLEREIKEMKKTDAGPWDKIAGIINQIGVENLMGAFMNKKLAAAQVAGIPTEMQHTDEVPETDTQPDAHARLQQVIDTFQAYDPNWLDTLEKMAAKVQANPGILNTLKSFL